MLVSLFIFLSTISGVLLGYMFGSKQLYRTIPITLMSIVTVLYAFGLIGRLKLGVIVVDALIILIYLTFVVWIIIRRDKLFLHVKTLLPCFAIWLLFLLVFNYCDKGMMTHNWDEFSHWASTVKIMTYLDDFTTNENSLALYKTYPPTMSLLQYYFQKNKMWIKGDVIFTEWRLYLVYHLFVASFLMPLFDIEGKAYKKIFKVLVPIWICVLFYKDMPECLYIDPFVAALAGYSILSTVFVKQKDKLHLINISLSLICLALAKDVGMYFVLVSGIIFLFDSLDYSIKSVFSGKTIYGIVPLFCAFLGKSLWKHELLISGVKPKPTGLTNALDYIGMLIFRNGEGYKQEVVCRAYHAFFENRLDMGLFRTSYCFMLVILSVMLFFALYMLYKDEDITAKKARFIAVFGFLMVGLYSLTIGLIYVNNFGEYEAMSLASYERYMNMVFVCYALMATCIFLDSLKDKIHNINSIAILAVIIGLVFGLTGSVNKYLSREDARSSESFENNYKNITSTLWAYCTVEDRVYFLSIGDMGIDHLVAEFKAYPYQIVDAPWSVGGPYFEGDIWSDSITSDEWMDKLVESYDYVYIHKVKDGFVEEYTELFEDDSCVTAGALFRIDKENRILIRCN